MDCRTILESNIEIVKNKRIGRVIFIVEGNKTEILLLKYIFMNILGYNYISNNRDHREFKFVKQGDKNSIVYVFNSKNSNISSIANCDEVSEEVTSFIQEKYDKDFAIEYAAIYYLFDRDYKSNSGNIIKELMQKYNNARDITDNYDRQGMLLLSYPSIEAYFMECLQKDYEKYRFDLGKDLKPFLQKRKKNHYKLSEENVIRGFKNSVKTMKRMKVNYIDLDDFTDTNELIFKYQENLLQNNGFYKLLSLLSIALLDLGIIKCKVNKKRGKHKKRTF